MGVYFLSEPWEKAAQIQLPEQECMYSGNVLLSPKKDMLIFTVQGNTVYGISLDDFNIAWKIPSKSRLGRISHLFWFNNSYLFCGVYRQDRFCLLKIDVYDGLEKSLFSTHSTRIIRFCEKNIFTLNTDSKIVMANLGDEIVREFNIPREIDEPGMHDFLPGKEFGKYLVYAEDHIFICNFDKVSKFKIDGPKGCEKVLIYWDEENDQVLLARGFSSSSIFKIDIKSGKSERLFLNTAFCCLASSPIGFGKNFIVMCEQYHMYILNTKNNKKSQVFYDHSIRRFVLGNKFIVDSFSIDVNEEYNCFAYVNGEKNQLFLYDLTTYDLLWEHHCPDVRLVKCIDKNTLVLGMEDGSIQKWKRRYPPGWLGHFCRPEIWFAVLFIALSICAIIRKVIGWRNQFSTAKVDG
jgi:hypothetical protein